MTWNTQRHQFTMSKEKKNTKFNEKLFHQLIKTYLKIKLILNGIITITNC